MARRRSRARDAYYKRAYYVRERRRMAVALGLALSTTPGGPNRQVAGAGSGIPVPPPNFVVLNDAVYTDVPYRGPAGDTITYHPVIKLFDYDRSYYTGTLGGASLTAR